MNRTPLGTSPKPRGRCHKVEGKDAWVIWTDIATGYGLSMDGAWQAWRCAESRHQLQCVSPRRGGWLKHIACWMDC
jgi:hypothetical protein